MLLMVKRQDETLRDTKNHPEGALHMIDSYENRETGAQGRQNLLWTPSPVSDDISGSVIWAGQKVDLNSQLPLFDGIGGFGQHALLRHLCTLDARRSVLH